MPNQLEMTQAQRREATSLEVSIIQHMTVLGPIHGPAALRMAIINAELDWVAYRYLGRELDRHADALERKWGL